MFPIPFNFPFRKKDGSVTTLDAAISGGGTPYTLPTASADTKGGVKIGEGLTMDGETLKNINPTPPTPYTLPTASDETLGGVKVGDGLTIDENGVLSASGGGGGGLSYVDVELPSYVDVNSNSWAMGQFAAPAAIIGKKIVSVQIKQGNSASVVCAGITYAHDTVSSGAWIPCEFYNNGSNTGRILAVRVFYI